MDHVSKTVNGDTLDIRRLNMYKSGDVTPFGNKLQNFNVDEIIDQLIASSDYANRKTQVNNYNQANRWKKKGISVMPLKWNVGWRGAHHNVTVSIYSYDGSISVLHVIYFYVDKLLLHKFIKIFFQ